MYLLGEERKGAFSEGGTRGTKLSQCPAHPGSSYHRVWPFPRLLHALFLVLSEKSLGSPPPSALVPCRADPCCPGGAAYRPAFVYLPKLGWLPLQPFLMVSITCRLCHLPPLARLLWPACFNVLASSKSSHDGQSHLLEAQL